jgi:hypothetical protein
MRRRAFDIRWALCYAKVNLYRNEIAVSRSVSAEQIHGSDDAFREHQGAFFILRRNQPTWARSY